MELSFLRPAFEGQLELAPAKEILRHAHLLESLQTIEPQLKVKDVTYEVKPGIVPYSRYDHPLINGRPQ